MKIDIENVYEQYMELDIKDIDNYIKSIALENDFNPKTVKALITKYAKKTNCFDEYNERKNEIKTEIKKTNAKQKINENALCYIIKECIEKKDYTIIDSYSKKRSVYSYLKRYLKVYPEDKDKVEEFKRQLRDYRVIYKNDEDFFIDLKNDSIHYKYIYVFNELLKKISSIERIMYLKKLQINEKNYKLYVKRFKTRYPNRFKEIKIIENSYQEYLEYFNKNEKKTSFKQEYLDSDKDLYYDLLLSGLSKAEYCHVNLDVDITSLNLLLKEKAVKISKNYKKEIEIIENRSDDNVKEKILIITNKIIEGNRYDIIDYFNETKLCPKDFIRLSRQYVSNKLLKKYLCEFFKSYSAINNIGCFLETELDRDMILSGIEITDSMKIKVFNYLEENEIPKTVNTYKVCLKKFLNKNLNLESKIKVKKQENF